MLLLGLIGIAPRALYEMLFGAVAATLTEFAAKPRWLGGTPAFSLVLHTWKQDLARHVHIHALVAGGALAPSGEWRSTRRGFLFPVKALSKVFRGKFVAALKAARENGTPAGAAALDAATFIDRFLLHVLPKGFKRIRHYGLLGPAGKTTKLALARTTLSAPMPDPVLVESPAAFLQRIDRIEATRCPHCGKGSLVPTAGIAPTCVPGPLSRGPP